MGGILFTQIILKIKASDLLFVFLKILATVLLKKIKANAFLI
jgi:hypothetical protein